MSRLTLDFCLFIEILIDIVTLFAIEIIFILAQILITLLFLIFFDYNSINFCGQSVRGLILLAITWANSFFSRLTQGLARLTWLVKLTTTTTTIISNKDIRSFFNLKLFLALRITSYWLVAIEIIIFTLSSYKKDLASYFSLDIYNLLNDLLPIG